MRRFILPISILLVLLVSSFIFIPYLFKDKIIATIKTEANKQLNAQIDFNNDIGINVFKTFPNLNVTIRDLVITSTDTSFSNDTLIAIGKTNVSFDLMEFYRNQNYIFKSLDLTNPKLYLESTDSADNWDIFIADENKSKASPITLHLEEIILKNGDFSYRDGATSVNISTINHESSGVYSTDVFEMDATTSAERVKIAYDGISYLDDWEMTQKGRIKVDLANDNYALPNNDFAINGLHTSLNGDMTLKGDDILFNVVAGTANSDLNEILTLIPAIYQTEYEDITSKGTSSFSASFIGTYNDISFPAYAVKAKIADGYFKYPDMPLAMDKLNTEINIYSKDGVIDHTVIDIPRIAFSLDDNPLSGRLKLTQLFSSPYIDLSVKGKADLASVTKLVPTQDVEMKGKITTDMDIIGSISAIQQSALNKFKATGDIMVKDLYYQSEDMQEALDLEQGHLFIRDQGITIDKLDGSLGKNDVNFYGQFDNFFAYLLNEKPLEGKAVLTSNNFNLNDFYSTEVDDDKSGEMTLVEIPGNIKLLLTAAVKQLRYDNLTFDNFSGEFEVENKQFNIKNLASNFLSGRVNFTGQYAYDPLTPAANFDITYSEIELHKLLDKFQVLSAFIPLAEKVESFSSAQIQFSSPLNLNMSPKLEKVNMAGALRLKDLTLDGSHVLKSIDQKLGTNHFDVTKLRDMLLKFSIKDGSLITEPFDINIDQANLKLEGVSKLDKTLAYEGKLLVPSSYVQNEVSVINNLLKNSAVKNLELKPNEYLEIAVNITGKINDPEVRLNLREIKQAWAKTVKDSITNIVDDKKKAAQQELDKQVRELKDEADKKLEETRNKVAEELDNKRKEAEEKLKKEAEEKKKKLKEEASKKLKNVFK